MLYIPVSDATALTFLNPIFAMLFAIIAFKEPVDFFRWSAALISFFGGLLLLRPTVTLGVEPVALLCLFGALIMGLEIICIKILAAREKIFNILLLNNFFALCLGSLLLPIFFKVPSLLEFGMLLLLSMVMLTGQFFFLNSVKRAQTSFLMPFFFTTLIFVILFDLVFFDVTPDSISYTGGGIIVLGSLFVALREWKAQEWS